MRIGYIDFSSDNEEYSLVVAILLFSHLFRGSTIEGVLPLLAKKGNDYFRKKPNPFRNRNSGGGFGDLFDLSMCYWGR